MMNRVELKVEDMAQVVGGSQADCDAFVALAYAKGWQTNNGLDGKMAAANMYKAVGMKTVKWKVASGEPAVFIDNGGGEHSFEEIYAKMQALPNK